MAGYKIYTLKFVALVFVATFFLTSCKETEDKNFDNNTALSPHRIPTIKIEGYVNRLFIDLVGRSPLESELERETIALKEALLSKESREALVDKLQNDTTEVEGDSSYAIAYVERLYIIMKSRMVEGADDGEFSRYTSTGNRLVMLGRLNGDSIEVFKGMDLIKRNQNVIDGKYAFRNGEITINELFARMMDNDVYDFINMNTFNFVNASFDDLFYRFPTQQEFGVAFNIVEKNETGALLGGFASNKGEYCTLLTESDEFYEGLIRWTYITLLGREPTTQEIVNHFETIYTTKDFRLLQKEILILDEYADF